MKLVALMAARNEGYELGMTARAALMWCDAIVLLNHASADDTAQVIAEVEQEHPGRVVSLYEPDPVWREMTHRQMMLDHARHIGATHIAYVDADEILTGSLLESIRPWTAELPAGVMLMLPWLQLRDSLTEVMSTGMWAQQNASVIFRDEPRLHWAARDGYDFHQREPLGREWGPRLYPVGRASRVDGLMHMQFVSMDRLRLKQLAYCLTERIRWPEKRAPAEIVAMYGRTVREAERASVAPTPGHWWQPYGHLKRYLDLDREPWQRAQCLEVLRAHPGVECGLDDFGTRMFAETGR